MINAIFSVSIAIVIAYLALRMLLLYRRTKKQSREIEKVLLPRREAENRLQSFQEKYSSLQREYVSMREACTRGSQLIRRHDFGIGTVDAQIHVLMTRDQQPEQLESQLNRIQNECKDMVREKIACTCDVEWKVNNRRAAGKKIINREIKLRLRCFDNACKAAISLVDWNNINRLKDRLRETFEEINRTGDVLQVYLNSRYLRLRLEELELHFELRDRKRALDEERKQERRIEREAEREAVRIKKAAEKVTKEREYQEKFVAEELAKLESLRGEESQSLQARVEEQQLELARLREKESRALSMAQQTRAGYVYIISNSKSFGDGICKIGMTRRVDPHDRVNELGDASVPEAFLIHAFIYCEDAPALEKHLHEAFATDRVNLVNSRKEFFFVSPNQVLEEVGRYPNKVSVHLPSSDGTVDLVRKSDSTGSHSSFHD